MYFSLLTTILSSCLSISVNNHLTNELVEEPTDKIIYIDVSLNNSLIKAAAVQSPAPAVSTTLSLATGSK